MSGAQTRRLLKFSVNDDLWVFNRIVSVAARLGLEPRQNESESFVLPLHHRAKEEKSDRKTGAGDGIRTRNRLFTKQVLYR